MKFKMIDNAIDSLKLTIDFFYSYADEENKQIKLVVICLHNAIELLLKSMLIKENEILIYDIKSMDIIFDAMRLKAKQESSLNLDEILISRLGVKTISYEQVVDMSSKLFDFDKKVNIVLKRLGSYRNAITHFGIDQSEDYTELINVIFETMSIVLDVLYPYLLEISDYFSYDDIIDFFDDFIEGGYGYQLQLCLDVENKKMNSIFQMIGDAFLSENLKLFLEKNCVSMFIESMDVDRYYFAIEFENEKNLSVEMYSYYSSFHNATIIWDEGGEIYFIIEHDTEKIFLYNECIKYDTEPEIYKQ